MTERQTDADFDAASHGTPADAVAPDAECASERALAAEQPRNEPADPEHPAFDPFSFSRLSVSPELRQQLVQARLPRLDPDYLQDTLPPNLEPEVQRAPINTLPAPVAQPRKRASVLVALCLLGAAPLLWFGLLRPIRPTLVTPQPALAPRRVAPSAGASSHAAAEQASVSNGVASLPDPSPGPGGSSQASAARSAQAQASLRTLGASGTLGTVQVVAAGQPRGSASAKAATSATSAAAAALNAASTASAAPASPVPSSSAASPAPWFDYKK